MTTWQVQAAKQRFSELLRAAEAGEPQFITKHGTPVAVLVDIDDFRASKRSDRKRIDFLLTGSHAVALDDDLELPTRARG
ncbi:type II toxin-antitoxin system Phd/YefM family antitoxin [uncultured Agrococcus sp.]|uniref:type II toxin-antitoxin system Phd/YefM family antitoxin n=1 Tax=uncultured Agrococcus sp. TaxID=382258 RepID=UPI0025FB634A|nr:type II toxin-antitoxin system Phd/YefM family antitoxin [uncultured Agrococcus sp.]